MICPDCEGRGRVLKRFLFFFTRRARCPKCDGTGTFPPSMRPRIRMTTMPSGARDRDDDRWTTPSSGSAGNSAHAFDVGGGGRSGGGGSTASWGSSNEAPPVIADPFGGDSSSAVTSAIASDAADAGSESSASAESGDGGTSY